MTATAAAPSTSLKGLGLMMLSMFMLTCTDAVTKWLGSTYPPGQIICLRAFFALIPIAVMVTLRGGLPSLRVVDLRGQMMRAAAFTATTILIALSMILLPIADAAAILYAGPLFITALAAPMLGERIGWRRWTAVFVGFVGVMVMLRPTAGAFQALALIPLAAAFTSSLRDIYSRSLSATETSNSMMFWSGITITVVSAFSYFLGWKEMPLRDLGVLALIGTIIGVAHYVMIGAYRAAEAAVVAPFKYSAIVWAVILGYVFWGDVPDYFIVTGGTIVVACGLYILHRETRSR